MGQKCKPLGLLSSAPAGRALVDLWLISFPHASLRSVTSSDRLLKCWIQLSR